MAALVSASLMSVSAFYIHKRSVDQVSDRLIEIRRKPLSRLRSQHSDDKVDDKEEDDYINEEDEWDQRRDLGSDGDAVIDLKSAPSQFYRIFTCLVDLVASGVRVDLVASGRRR